jgi:hypothetical protein
MGFQQTVGGLLKVSPLREELAPPTAPGSGVLTTDLEGYSPSDVCAAIYPAMWATKRRRANDVGGSGQIR